MNILRRLKNWRRDENGSGAVEFVLAVPAMLLLLTLATDATLLMHQQQNLYNAARDASRQVALGQKTETEAEAFLASRFDTDALTVSVVQANGFVTTTVSVPFGEYAHLSGMFSDGELQAHVSMWVENNEG